MDTQPPEDPFALVRKVSELQTELTEIKRLLENLARDIATKFPLTDQPNYRYYYEQDLDNQEKTQRRSRPIANSNQKQAGKLPQSPYVGEGEQATCTRCGHTWTPFVRRPKQCPACRQTWYKPKAWTRNKSSIG